MEHFGQYLKAQREAKNKSIEEIAGVTKINLHNLQLLEAGRWSELPPEPFIKGFITAYSRYLGLNPKATVEEYILSRSVKPDPTFEEITPVPKNDPAHDAEHEIEEGEKGLPFGKFAIGAVGVAVVVGLVWVISVGKNLDKGDRPKGESVVIASPTPTAAQPTPIVPEVVPPLAPLVPLAPEPTAVAMPEEGPTPTPVQEEVKIATAEVQPEVVPTPVPTPVVEVPPTPAPVGETAEGVLHQMVIEGKERAWMKIVVDNNPPKELFINEGKQLTFSAKEKIKLIVANHTSAKVTHNGELVAGNKIKGTIRSYVFPDGAEFPQDIKKKARETATTTPLPEVPATEPQ